MKTKSQLQETTGGIADGPAPTYDARAVGQALLVRNRLKQFSTIMYMFKFTIAIFTLYAATCALRKWTDYRASSKWVLIGFIVRVFITVFASWLPWYGLFFDDEDQRPRSMNLGTAYLKGVFF